MRGLQALAGVVALALTIPTIDTAGAQGFSWPDRAENLQVLPATTSADELSNIMRGFTGALGVRCSHCHVGEEGQPLSTYDFASDDNSKKQVAREMLRLVDQVNGRLDAFFDGTNSVPVTCATCHRGNTWPITIEAELDAALESGGARAAVEAYQDLRERHYGGYAYDFSERTLDRYARGLLDGGQSEAAVALLLLNTELSPESSNAFFSLGIAYERAGDAELARLFLEKALLLDPGSGRVRRALESLGGS